MRDLHDVGWGEKKKKEIWCVCVNLIIYSFLYYYPNMDITQVETGSFNGKKTEEKLISVYI